MSYFQVFYRHSFLQQFVNLDDYTKRKCSKYLGFVTSLS